MGDKRKGGAKGAVAYFLKTFIVFIVLPLAFYYSMPYLFDAVAPGIAGDMKEQVETLWPYIEKLVLCSIPLVVISIPLGYFARGDKRKVPFRIAYGIAAAALVWTVTNGGKFNIAMNDVGLGAVSVSSFSIALNNTTLIMITMLICVLRGFMGILEYRSYRDEFGKSTASK